MAKKVAKKVTKKKPILNSNGIPYLHTLTERRWYNEKVYAYADFTVKHFGRNNCQFYMQSFE